MTRLIAAPSASCPQCRKGTRELTIIEAIAAVVSDVTGCTTDYIVGQLPQYTRRQITDALRLSGARHGLRYWHKTWWIRKDDTQH